MEKISGADLGVRAAWEVQNDEGTARYRLSSCGAELAVSAREDVVASSVEDSKDAPTEAGTSAIISCTLSLSRPQLVGRAMTHFPPLSSMIRSPSPRPKNQVVKIAQKAVEMT